MLRDGQTGEILTEFKDREVDKAAPFTIKDFQRYAHARLIMGEWAKTFAELATTTWGHKVEGPLPVTLNPF